MEMLFSLIWVIIFFSIVINLDKKQKAARKGQQAARKDQEAQGKRSFAGLSQDLREIAEAFKELKKMDEAGFKDVRIPGEAPEEDAPPAEVTFPARPAAVARPAATRPVNARPATRPAVVARPVAAARPAVVARPTVVAAEGQGASMMDEEGCVGGSMAHVQHEGESRREHHRHMEEALRREQEEARAAQPETALRGLNLGRLRQAVVMAEILDRPRALRRTRY